MTKIKIDVNVHDKWVNGIDDYNMLNEWFLMKDVVSFENIIRASLISSTAKNLNFSTFLSKGTKFICEVDIQYLLDTLSKRLSVIASTPNFGILHNEIPSYADVNLHDEMANEQESGVIPKEIISRARFVIQRLGDACYRKISPISIVGKFSSKNSDNRMYVVNLTNEYGDYCVNKFCDLLSSSYNKRNKTTELLFYVEED